MTTKTLTISECISRAYADAAKKQDIASKGQMAAANALGMTYGQAMKLVATELAEPDKETSDR